MECIGIVSVHPTRVSEIEEERENTRKKGVYDTKISCIFSGFPCTLLNGGIKQREMGGSEGWE